MSVIQNKNKVGGGLSSFSQKVNEGSQCNAGSICIITDPSGEIYNLMADKLKEKGYDIKLFSGKDSESCSYNPFSYISEDCSDERVSRMVSSMMQNLQASNYHAGGDRFFRQTIKAILTAGILYIMEFVPEEERNLNALKKLMEDGFRSKLDLRFEAAKAEKPEARFITAYREFQLAPHKTANSVFACILADMKASPECMITTRASEEKNIDLCHMPENRTCIFVCPPDANQIFGFAADVMNMQLAELLLN